MNVLSLFDWISCARVALERAWIKVDKYYASEIDKYAIQIAQKNYPSTIQIGSVVWITYWRDTLLSYPDMWFPWKIDLLIGWSPCQDLSIAKAWRKWLDWERSWLFREYVRILKETSPKYFILENVASMPNESKQKITEIMGVEPIMINASLVSAQSRKRLFRTNIPWVTQPEDKWILLKDILLPETYTEYDKSYPLTASYNWAVLWNSIDKNQRTMVWTKPIKVWHFKSWWQWQRVYSIEWKSVTLSAMWWWRWAKTWLYQIKDYARKLEPIECERLQWLPDNYTEWVSKNERRKTCWNAFNVDVVAHILSFIKKDTP